MLKGADSLACSTQTGLGEGLAYVDLRLSAVTTPSLLRPTSQVLHTTITTPFISSYATLVACCYARRPLNHSTK